MQLSRYRWLIWVLIFFIAWKLILAAVMWHGRELPPEPDDSLVYSGHINLVSSCPRLLCDSPYVSLQSATGYRYLSYSLLWGVVDKVLPLDSIQVYQLSFYVGIVLLALVLAYYVTKLTTNIKLAAVSLFCLALFAGTGGIHGFFWVVPSFYAVMLFFLLLGLVLDDSGRRVLPILIVLPVFIFMHPLSRYFLAVFPLFFLIYWALTRNFNRDLFEKIALVTVMGGLIYLPVAVYLHEWTSLSSQLNVLVLQQVLLEPGQDASIDTTPVRRYFHLSHFQRLKPDYLNWLFPHPLAVVPFVFFSYLIFRFKQYKLVALYLGTCIFVAIATFVHWEGYRSLVLLWPITFIWYGFGFWWSYVLVRQKIRTRTWRVAFYTVISTGLMIFIVVNLIYSLLLSHYFNINDDIAIDARYVDYLLDHTSSGEPVEGMKKVIVSYSLNSDLIYRPQHVLGQTKYYIDYIWPTAADTVYIMPPLEYFSRVTVTLFKGQNHYVPFLINDAVDLYLRDPQFLEHLILEKEFGRVRIYRNPNYQ